MSSTEVTKQQNLSSGLSEFNTRDFHIRQVISDLSTCALVKVIAVTPGQGVNELGSVDVKPLVSQMDGNGNPVDHGTVFNVPYVRYQGGTNAVIIDPEVNDIGMCCFADRDISRVKINKSESLPGSKRVMNIADALYIGGLLNSVPTRFIKFSSAGIEITGIENVIVTAQQINMTADSTDVNITATGKTVVTAPEVDVISSTKVVVDSPLIELGENAINNIVLADSPDPLGLTHPGTDKIKGTS